MQRIGTASHLAQGLLIVRAGEAIDPGLSGTVVDETLQSIGNIVTIFGPKSRPYIGIALVDDATPASLLGEPIYLR